MNDSLAAIISGILDVFTARFERKKLADNFTSSGMKEMGREELAVLDPFSRIVNGYAIDDRANGKVRNKE